MKRWALVFGLTLAVAGGSAWAQEPAEEEERPQPRRTIRVLENPYDLASFYRSSQGSGFLGGPMTPDRGPYPIASYYRQQTQAGPYGFSRFWSNGYSARDRGGFTFAFRQRIGENGDLFLFTPTFLAPVGPLTGVFFFDLDR